MSFFSELKRRNVVRMALLYVVGSWVLLQIADVLFDPLGLPEWTFRLVLGLLLLGFPFALIFAWIFELTPDGLKRESEVTADRSIARQTGRKMNLVIVALLLVAITGLALDRFVPKPSAPPEVARDSVAASAEPAQEDDALPDNTIAVLPFVNMSGDPDNEYFSDGLTEELLNTLVRIGGLKVTGRTSSFAFKGQNQDLREIGQMLNVANVLEGSVRKAGNRVRITAQLIKTADGFHLWSDTFDRELNDIFAIQEEIADQVTDALHVALLDDRPAEQADAANREPSGEAYEEYLRGMYILNRDPDNIASLVDAREHVERALALEPDYLDANWGMFRIWERYNRNGHGPFEESFERMQHYSDVLQRLAPESEPALGAAAQMAAWNYEYAKARNFWKTSVERFPGSANAWSQYASIDARLGNFESALEAANRAVLLDPLSLEALQIKASILYFRTDCQALEQVVSRALEIEPSAPRFRYYVSMCIYETGGDAERALPWAEAEPLDWMHETSLAILLHALGRTEEALKQRDILFNRAGNNAAYQLGQIHAQWREPELALDWLETAVEVRDPGIVQVANDRLLDPLRTDPRFERILRDAGFR